jgi:hypothetical protein
MGDDITDDDVRQALGRTHSELRARFFKRFEKSPCSVGCFYVARAALKHLESHGRAQVVRVISREASDVRDVFMVAATFDSSELVRKAAEEWLVTQDIDPTVQKSVLRSLGRSELSSSTYSPRESPKGSVSGGSKDVDSARGDLQTTVLVGSKQNSSSVGTATSGSPTEPATETQGRAVPSVQEQFKNLPIHKAH